MATRSLVCLVVALLLDECAMAAILSSRLIHRFSDEVKSLRVSRDMDLDGNWPPRRNLEYYRFLVDSDVQRQKMKLAPRYQLLFPSEGSKTMNLGNDFGWLYYTWVNIGTPSVSFLVALDTGSDLFWVPCNCLQCASLSASSYSNLDLMVRSFLSRCMWGLALISYVLRLSVTVLICYRRQCINCDGSRLMCSLVFGAFIVQDKDLNQYNPTGSSTNKHLNCSHQLCELGSDCKSPKQSCPYTVDYYSRDTSSSGFLVEDILHLVSGVEDSSNFSVKAPVIIGCGRKQSGSYLDGIAPDGLLGLGPGNISVPSFLSRSGMVHKSFSLCFNDDASGKIFFGDQGSSFQQTTSFLPLDEKFVTYIVGVEGCCIGHSCLVQTNFKALVDTGTSFTFLPSEVYEKVTKEFDEQINATATSYEVKVPWKYCYKSSSQEMPKIPSISFMFATNSSFTIHNSIFLIYENEEVVGFCLAVQPVEQDIAIIGQNFLTGYRLVFDQENLKLGWSPSDCKGLDGDDDKSMPLTPKGGSSIPLPTTQQQSAPGGHAVAPAEAGRTPEKSSSRSSGHQQQQFFSWVWMMVLLLLLSLRN